MAFFTGSAVRGSLQWIIVLAGLFLLFVPIVSIASTPPIQPSLSFEISNPSASENATITLSVTWNGYVSFNKPPEHIIVDVFSELNGERRGTFPIPRLEDACTSENTCIYRMSIEVEDFPSGTLTLIATDPLSEATNRQRISIPPHSNENSELFKQFEKDQMFVLASAILGAFLVFVLAILVREKI